MITIFYIGKIINDKFIIYHIKQLLTEEKLLGFCPLNKE